MNVYDKHTNTYEKKHCERHLNFVRERVRINLFSHIYNYTYMSNLWMNVYVRLTDKREIKFCVCTHTAHTQMYTMHSSSSLIFFNSLLLIFCMNVAECGYGMYIVRIQNKFRFDIELENNFQAFVVCLSVCKYIYILYIYVGLVHTQFYTSDVI